MPARSTGEDPPFFLFRWLAELWRLLGDIWRVLWPCRVSAVVLLGAVALLLIAEQGRETTLALGQATRWQVLAFFGALLLWIFLGWFWARTMLSTAFTLDRTLDSSGVALDRRTACMVDHCPRVIGLGSALLAAVNFVLLWKDSSSNFFAWLAAGAVGVAAFAYWFFYVRTAAIRHPSRKGWLSRLVRRIAAYSWFKPKIPDNQCYTRFGQLPRIGQWFIVGSLLLAGIATFVATRWTAEAAMWAGSLSVAFSAFAFLVAGGGILSFLSARLGFPLDVTVVLFALVISFSPALTDNHAIRTLALEDRQRPMPPSIDQALDDWHTTIAPTDGQQPPAVVIVATAGGALRAAYWTTAVLNELEKRYPGFHRHVFAISGVSGGSVGATVFTTLRTVDPKRWDWSNCSFVRRNDPRPQEEWTPLADSPHDQARCILERDYVAPVLSGLLYTDLLQRFIPWPFLPDRATALERGFEYGWKRAGIVDATGRPVFETPFLNLRRTDAADGRWLPYLLLNGTNLESGKRIITSDLKIDASVFVDAYDIYEHVGDRVDFRISTAANNSARFPYVEPAGTLMTDGGRQGHVVDGGYFENFGATTAKEVLRAVRHHFGDKVRPIVVQITSDPGLLNVDLPLCAASLPKEDYRANGQLHPVENSTEASAPVDTLFATREARGILAAKELCRMAAEGGSDDPSFFHFRMSHHEVADPGLGWTLSGESFQAIESYLRMPGNVRQFDVLADLLKRT
jgi:hypothetical protein